VKPVKRTSASSSGADPGDAAGGGAARRLGKRRLGGREREQARVQLAQRRVGEAGAHLARVAQRASCVDAEEQRAHRAAAAARRGEAADDELLPRAALHLEPAGAAAVIGRERLFGDDALEPEPAGAPEHLGPMAAHVIGEAHALGRGGTRGEQATQRLLALQERRGAQILVAEEQEIEDESTRGARRFHL
jgi:hypothetical protein